MIEFMEFLQKEHCHENLMYLDAVSAYSKLAAPLFPLPIVLSGLPSLPKPATENTTDVTLNPDTQDPDVPSKPSGMKESQFEDLLEALKSKREQMKAQFIMTDSPNEINLTSKLRKPLMESYEKGSLHPDHFKGTYDHIQSILKNDTFLKFIKSAPERTGKPIKAPETLQQIEAEPPRPSTASKAGGWKRMFGKA